ncbi:membrane protein [Bacteroidia bacterium]|nr:membrane protein [Bacteroidia bacterium]GHU82027.1 membrane protein [Bacteroidia bacterium]GHV71269.1 membrane protein [Bacteroidia bacterium]
MKKISVVIFAFLWIFVFAAQAQIKIGVKAGANLAKADFNVEALKPENYTGFQVGPILELKLPIPIGFNAAILYSQQGLKFKDSSFEEKMSTLDVPVNLKFNLNLSDYFGAYLTAGPYASFKLSDEYTIKNLENDAKNKKFGVGVNLGGGVELLKHLQVGVNYQICLNNDYSTGVDLTDYEGVIFGELKGKTRIWSITAAYFF